MPGIWRPKATVRIIANKMSSEPEIAVAMAIGLSMDCPPPSHACAGTAAGQARLELRRQLAAHEFREKAFARGTEIGGGNRLRSAATHQVEGQLFTARSTDRDREEIGRIRN